ncbi:MAG: membrane dipeptidase [Bacteroidota bacterium]
MSSSPLLFDAHLDLSMNALEWNRDLRQPIGAINQREAHLTDKPDRGNSMVNFAEMRRGNIGICVATLIARYVKISNPLPGWHSPEQAWAQTQGQLAWYKAMETAGELRAITNWAELEAHLEKWQSIDSTEHEPIGYVLSLEGADSIVDLSYVEKSYEKGLRAIGPAHYGPGTYAFGTDSTGGIGQKGKELLQEMERFNIILDATHLCDESFWEAMRHFKGAVWASHSNCRTLVSHNRQFSDEQLKVLIERGAVIGGVLDSWMLVPNWVRGESTPQSKQVTLEKVIDHYDHICQLAGNADHIGIGTDLDGGFGSEQAPYDLKTIADMQKLPDLLQERGFSEVDIEKVLSGNWLRFLKNHWEV